MQDTPYHPNAQTDSCQGMPPVDELTRVFNSAMVATKSESLRDFSAEMVSLIDSPAFRSILSSIRQLARSQGISEREAAENVIQTYRRLDRLWESYLIQEGVEKIRS